MSPKGTPVEHGPIEIVWEAPPEPVSNAVAGYDAVLDEVKKTPGQWARLRVFVTANGYTIRGRLVAKHKDPRWEFKVVKTGEKEWALYARYRTPEQVTAANGR